MAGGRSFREDGVRNIVSTNIFSALETRRKKPIRKNSGKDKQEFVSSALPPSSPIVQESVEPASWTPTPVSVMSWADCEDDAEDFSIPVLPPLPSLGNETAEAVAEEQEKPTEEDGNENSEGSEGYDDVEEGNEENKEPPLLESKASGTCIITHTGRREPDRQMSKRELKKMGLDELEAALSELGLNQVIETDDSKVATTEGAFCDGNAAQEASGPSVAASRSFKRRKAKKDRPVKDSRQEEPQHGVEPSVTVHEAISGHEDRNELLKKLPSVKKKKSKDDNSAARAVAAEAAMRAAKLAAAKRKEKSHYNQSPR